MSRSRFAFVISLALATGALFLASPSSADDTFVVDSTADQIDSDLIDVNCRTAANTCTLRAAVMQANVNPGTTTILLPAGVFQLSRLPSGPNGADNGDLNLTKLTSNGFIVIRGAGRGATVIDGGDLDRIFFVDLGSYLRLEDVTVRNGTASNGGGILTYGALSLVGVRIADNVATIRGGGISIDTVSSVSLDFCDVTGNQSAAGGGGIHLSESAGGIVNISYGAVRGNTGQVGGGIFHAGEGVLTIQHTTVSGNEAQIGGGMVANDEDATVFVRRSTFDGNRATSSGGGPGGGIGNYATLYFVNGTISGNHATGSGGGLYNDGNATLYNSTIAFNEADSDADPGGGTGGGLFSSPVGVLAIRNSALAGNFRSGAPVADDCSGAVGAYGHNRLTSFAGCTVTHTGACGGSDLLLASSSELGPLGWYGGPTRTHPILAGSSLIDDVDTPCICQDELATTILQDQRLGSRASGARCDVGAHEFGGLPPGSLFSDGFELGTAATWN